MNAPRALSEARDNGLTADHSDASLAAVLLAVALEDLRGAVLYCDSRATGELWGELLHSLLPSGAPSKRVPGNVSEERLLGGLDFSATLARGTAVGERGLLAEADGGCVALSAATARASTYSHVGRALDSRSVMLERDGLSAVHPTRFAVVITQTADDEMVASALADRLAFHVSLGSNAWRSLAVHLTAQDVVRAREIYRSVKNDDGALVALAHAAVRLNVDSPRPVLMALAAARAHAALHGRAELEPQDLACAARLVLAPRAIEREDSHPPAAPDDAPAAESSGTPEQREIDADSSDARNDRSAEPQEAARGAQQELTEILVRSALTALPAGLLTTFAARSVAARSTNGRSGDEVLRGNRGRPVGVRRGDPRGGARLDIVATLRAAIPMQRIRRQMRGDATTRRVELRRDDFRIRQCITPATTTALFVVDASGSAAMQRLAEAKGAVELMLAEGYARRDCVALITFRGTTADLVLPPTHALARARRAISGLPAGGGTPLATALDLATSALQQMQRRGGQFVTIILTDGRANVARDGSGGRPRAMSEALEAAARLGSVCSNVLWVDTAARSEAASRQLAAKAGARYLLLPAASANSLTSAVRGGRAGAVA